MCVEIRLRFPSVRRAQVKEHPVRLWMKNCGARESFEVESRENQDQRRPQTQIRIRLPRQRLVRREWLRVRHLRLDVRILRDA